MSKLSFCSSYLLVGLVSGLYLKLILILLTYLKSDGEHKFTVVKAVKAVKGYLLLHQEIQELVLYHLMCEKSCLSSYVKKIQLTGLDFLCKRRYPEFVAQLF